MPGWTIAPTLTSMYCYGVTSQEPCQNKVELISAYIHATTAYAQAVSDLQFKIPTTVQSEYKSLYFKSEESREAVECARRNLEWHVAQHGC
jgi:hypothetical protein